MKVFTDDFADEITEGIKLGSPYNYVTPSLAELLMSLTKYFHR